MSRPIRVSLGLFLTATLSLGVVAGCASTTPEEARAQARDAVRDYVRDEVKDPERQRAVLGILDLLDAELAEGRADVEGFRAELNAKVADYSAGRAELVALYQARDERRRARRARVLDLHFKVREALSDDEWPGFLERELEVFRANLPRAREGKAAGVQDEGN